MTDRQIRIPEQDGLPFRLGRHVLHDDASKDFPATMAPGMADVLHTRLIPILDQGNLGSCTGNACAGLLCTEPQYDYGIRLTEEDAVGLYSLATQIDPWPGVYPPDDTGSDGLSVAKAAKRMGRITTYRHAFGLDHALKTLVLHPVITGVNWYDSMFFPDANGEVHISPNASVAGGHEFVARGMLVEQQKVRCSNSWNTSWGDKGEFVMSFTLWDRLLQEQGDVTAMH
jgi:hypothetical protein